MIKAVIFYKGGYITGFNVEGHAGYADEGYDIYCAGISAITQTALIGLLKHLKVKPEYTIEKGDLKVKLPTVLDEEDRDKAQIILSTMEAGLVSLEDAYKHYFSLERRRC
ncbi:ribosomal-processing cysteine protease Prp [Thermosyntropha sp.]|uniref:ribosomal-processing cysteine protease Prp n=1 Tax=Thermosyntropha sp. TaxID=2740820 RepID=UPI0025F01AC8|nr:ribosomal-processing cysteine protease Prp [Thermosyntropha sp.]MBO8158712.1 ribosomal-processing cysteine protease Prp [Thermosyntropha sp.]